MIALAFTTIYKELYRSVAHAPPMIYLVLRFFILEANIAPMSQLGEEEVQDVPDLLRGGRRTTRSWCRWPSTSSSRTGICEVRVRGDVLRLWIGM